MLRLKMHNSEISSFVDTQNENFSNNFKSKKKESSNNLIKTNNDINSFTMTAFNSFKSTKSNSNRNEIMNLNLLKDSNGYSTKSHWTNEIKSNQSPRILRIPIPMKYKTNSQPSSKKVLNKLK